MTDFKLPPFHVAPGEKAQAYLSITGTDFELPVTVINGSSGGPTVLITGGVHNAEFVGIQATIELASEILPDSIAGTLILMPLLNRSGFEHRTMSLTYKDNKNLNRVFPGDADGSPSDRLAAYLVKNIFPKIDYLIDLHCGDGFESLSPYVYCQGCAAPNVQAASLSMARCTAMPLIIRSQVGTGGLYNEAGSRGIPAVLIERGCLSLWNHEEVLADKQDVRNILKYLNVLDGEHTPNEHIPIFREIGISAPVGGCWYPSVLGGDSVKAGDTIGTIRDYFGNTLYTCTADSDMTVLHIIQSLNILKDDPMVSLAKGVEEI